ncbi:Arylsulfatase [Akanthomyces lecanii RCEF 1005]|uniref:Arylsulfatase n=1 Tax=Akanthomyces lecanii RCEF 1005 TaxID=1081108 RepID=A0A168JBI2_CORDF|nr:Arylsulfatase [Akanthomyces lecanii RCEF 1005]
MKRGFLLLISAATQTLASGNANHEKLLPERRAAARPNIVFILTDDQDARMNSLDYMQGVQTHLKSQGASYQNHFCTVALCCPSRVNLWTGRAPHNTNVTDLSPPYGGYPKFIKQGFNDDWLPVWMQQSGYQTYYVGKLMNAFDPSNYNSPYVNGFNGSDFLCGAETYNYFNPMYQRNREPPKTYKGQYTTDLLWNKSRGFLDDARKSNQPFFLTMAPVSPHVGHGPRPDGVSQEGPIPDGKYKNFFNDAKVPRTKNFNPDTPSGTQWLLHLDKQNQTTINNGDEYYRNRLRALQSVDEVVNNTISYLTEHNLMDNTYIIYSSDNGFHIGHHRMFPGKNCPYEEDVNVPLIIRGPGIEAGSTVNLATSHTDLAPTILRIAQAPLHDYLDGSAVPLIDPNPPAQNFEHAQIEHWGAGATKGQLRSEYPEAPGVVNTTYKALRIMGPGYNYYYSVWCTNQHELYDMSADSQQMKNLYTPYSYKPNEPQGPNNPFPINRLESRLDALLLVLKSCKAKTCIQPWTALHPGGKVNSLPDAMDPKYDEFYQKQQHRVSYNWCDKGYIVAAEGPQTYLQFQHTETKRKLGEPTWDMI